MKNYTVITSKETCTGLNWVIDAKSTLSEADLDFIAFFSPVVFFNDASCYHWAYDTKLPSGRRWFMTCAGTSPGIVLRLDVH
jgi:hypothetical protein|nr:MAG TPA: hypothetical protein [Caudoviricetes sp.]